MHHNNEIHQMPQDRIVTDVFFGGEQTSGSFPGQVLLASRGYPLSGRG
jgi:hypothetical protein